MSRCRGNALLLMSRLQFRVLPNAVWGVWTFLKLNFLMWLRRRADVRAIRAYLSCLVYHFAVCRLWLRCLPNAVCRMWLFLNLNVLSCGQLVCLTVDVCQSFCRGCDCVLRVCRLWLGCSRLWPLCLLNVAVASAECFRMCLPNLS